MSETKDTNPKDAVGVKKVGLTSVPMRVLMEVSLAMLEGALKYGKFNYRVAGVRSSVYIDAAMRHLMAYHEGQDIDPDSGLPHIVKAMACLLVLRDAEINNKLTDDRPPKLVGSETWIAELNKKAAQLIEKYPNPAAAYTQKEMESV